jgi:hypothetical protein
VAAAVVIELELMMMLARLANQVLSATPRHPAGTGKVGPPAMAAPEVLAVSTTVRLRPLVMPRAAAAAQSGGFGSMRIPTS